MWKIWLSLGKVKQVGRSVHTTCVTADAVRASESKMQPRGTGPDTVMGFPARCLMMPPALPHSLLSLLGTRLFFLKKYCHYTR